MCREVQGHAVCSCQSNYIGSPPGCRPECIVSSECSQDKACINQKCVDPCPGTCGTNALCQVINHNPICSCPKGFIGDPFIRCVVETSMITVAVLGHRSHDSYFLGPIVPDEPVNPCVPSPCGPNSQCRIVGSTGACSCLPNFIGRPPNCRPECTINEECSSNMACINEKCRDPCPGACGFNALCTVVNHSPVCACVTGYQGDPFSGCSPIPRKNYLCCMIFTHFLTS